MSNEAIEQQEPKFLTLLCQCRNDHEWEVLLPNYWFSVARNTCPTCDQPAKLLKSGNLKQPMVQSEAKEP